MEWLDAITDLGVITGMLTEEYVNLIESCFCTRGRRKGLILSSAPSSFQSPKRAAAWQALMSAISPMRVNIATVAWFLPDDARRVFGGIERWACHRHVVLALNSYGQRPYEFNMMDQAMAGNLTPDDFARAIRVGTDAYLAGRAYA